MLGRVHELARALRSAGVPVSLTEHLDALRALERIGLAQRQVVKEALAATMVKSKAHRPAFDTLFDLYFAPAPPGSPEPAAPAQLEQALASVLSGGGELNSVVRVAVESFGRSGTGAGEWFSQYQVLRALGLDTLVETVVADAAAGAPALQRALIREEIEERAEAVRAAVLAETRRRMAEVRGEEAVAAYALRPLPEDVSFLSATAQDIAELQRAVRPLARKLAARLALKRRRTRRGALDLRHTLRASMSSGGVPFSPRFRNRAPHRPEIVVLCDVSSSVLRFARFGLMLVHALAWQFTRVRSFAFIDAVDEITHLFDHEDFFVAVERVGREAAVVRYDGHSDYGACFEMLLEEHPGAVGPKTTLLILGDARSNHRPARVEALAELAGAARRTYWLNPEPRADWDTGDSIASAFGGVVDAMVEVRNLRQLEDFIAGAL